MFFVKQEDNNSCLLLCFLSFLYFFVSLFCAVCFQEQTVNKKTLPLCNPRMHMHTYRHKRIEDIFTERGNEKNWNFLPLYLKKPKTFFIWIEMFQFLLDVYILGPRLFYGLTTEYIYVIFICESRLLQKEHFCGNHSLRPIYFTFSKYFDRKTEK